MGLMAPGIGNIGKTVGGKSTPRTANGNGGFAVVGTLDIPEGGVWLVAASGWNPKNGTNAVMGLDVAGGSNICATDCTNLRFSMAGVVSLTGAATVNLGYTNWGSAQVANAQVAGLRFTAVKVGEV